MSVATEFAPVVFIPERARVQRPTATILTLRPPLPVPSIVPTPSVSAPFIPPVQRVCPATLAPPLRLTRRGLVVLAVAVAALAGVLVWIAALSAPAASQGTGPAPASVTVRSGDTLWSIATRIAPNKDPRAEVAALTRLNDLQGAALTPGQVIRTR